MKKKNIKKWIAGMMLPVTALGAMAGVIAVDSAINPTQVSAIYSTYSQTSGESLDFVAEPFCSEQFDFVTKETIEVCTMNMGNIYADDNQTLFKANTKYYISYESESAWQLFAKGSGGNLLKTINVSDYEVGEAVNDGLTRYSYTITTSSDFYLQWYVTTVSNTTKKTFKNLIVRESDGVKPVINGSSIYYTNYDNPKTLNDILETIYAIDETDGNVEVVVEEDNYTNSNKDLGEYTVLLSATDKAGNKAEMTLTIVVTDGTNPTISGVNTYISNMSSPITEATVRAGLSASDNYDQTLTIQLVHDGFTGNEQKAGSYTITYKTVDSSSNESETFVVTITNKDDIKPTLTGTNEYNVSSQGKLSIEHLISNLVASDNVSSDMEIKVYEDNYTDYSSIVGDHIVKFYVEDASGNISDVYDVTISVFDNIPPVFWTSKDFFSVDESLTLTHKDIVDVLIVQAGIDPADVTAYSVNQGTNYNVEGGNKPGNYALSYKIQLKSGEVVDLNSQINVIGEKDNVVDQIEDQEKIEQEARNFFQKAWDAIKGFFSNLWKWIVKYIGFGWAWDKEKKFIPEW